MAVKLAALADKVVFLEAGLQAEREALARTQMLLALANGLATKYKRGRNLTWAALGAGAVWLIVQAVK
jgi:hypothetical protein